MKDRLTGMSVFARVVEEKSFSAAAEKLGISKSLASRQVSALERSLAVKLLNRSTRRLGLTEAGATFYEHCARIVHEAELAEQRVMLSQSEPAGIVKVTAVPAFTVRHLLPLIGEFQRKYPKIRVKLSCSNQRTDLADSGFDLGIRVSFKLPPNLVARRLAVNRPVLCASPAYLEQNGVPRRIEDLQRHDCVVFPPLAPKGTWTFRRSGRKYPVRVTGTLETDETDAVRSAVLAGLGIGLIPAYIAGEDLREGRLVQLLRNFTPQSETGIYLVYLPSRSMPSRVRALIDFLVSRFEAVPSWERGW